MASCRSKAKIVKYCEIAIIILCLSNVINFPQVESLNNNNNDTLIKRLTSKNKYQNIKSVRRVQKKCTEIQFNAIQYDINY